MADNPLVKNGTGAGTDYTVAADDVTVTGAGGSGLVQYMKLVDGAQNGTSPIGGDATNGLDVDVTRLPALPSITAVVHIDDNAGSITVDNGGTFAVQADTEMPAAGALADATSNPTTPLIGAANELFNGTTWDRARGTTKGGFVQGDVAADAAVDANPLLDGGRASTAIPTAMSADGDAVPLWTDRSGAVVITPRPSATATLTNVTGSATSVNLIGSNTSRKSLVIVNDSSAILYVKFGATASTTSFTYKLAAGETLELPGADVIYTGSIDGIWASATGAARLSELS